MRGRTVVAIGAALVGADLLDLYSTYLATPDLARELNPMVLAFGLGWVSVLAIHVVVLGVLLFGLAYYHRSEPKAGEVPIGVDSLKKAFIWYTTGISEANRQIVPKRYLGFLCIFIPLGSIFNSICNVFLNLTFFMGYHQGLTASTVWFYQTTKMTIIILCLWIIFFLYLKKTYLKPTKQRSQ